MSQIEAHSVAPPRTTVPTVAETRTKLDPANAAIDAVLAMIERAADAGQVDTLERLLAWRDAQTAKVAAADQELAFKEALAAAQAEMTPIQADAANTETNNHRYATHAALDGAIRPIYTKHGFSLSFNFAEAPLAECVRIICEVSHNGGHTRHYHIDMPCDGKGPKGGAVMTRTHAMGSAITYAMRYLLVLIFNLAVLKRDDDDGNAAGRRSAFVDRGHPNPALKRGPYVEHVDRSDERRTPTFDDLQRNAMQPRVQALPPKHRLEDEFHPHPEDRRPIPRRGPAPAGTYNEDITNDARDAARKGTEAFREFCANITVGTYKDAVKPHLAEFKQLAEDADLAIPTFLDRRAAR